MCTIGNTYSLNSWHTADAGAMLQMSERRHLLPAGLFIILILGLPESVHAAGEWPQHESN